MSLRALQRVAKAMPNASNMSSPADLTHLPDVLLETFIPGYSLLSSFITSAFGFEVSTLVSIVAVGVALTMGWQYVYKRAEALFLSYFTSSIHIESDDEFFYYMSNWITKFESLKTLRYLQVKTVSDYDEFGSDENKPLEKFHEEELFNYSNWEARIPPKYMPSMGSHWFWYKGSCFRFERKRENVTRDSWMGQVLSNEKSITVTVLGRSTEPAKRLLMEAREKSLAQESSKTIVRRPSPKETRGRGRQAWMRVAMRPSRPMETVVLDRAQKTSILSDINEFVHPETPRWYANRGIPYRRGYLFHGPPGTGKTSLSFALAGVFGLDIYCISLLEPTLTEEDLSILFNNLPPRCVVLLEDIDSAGLHRKDESSKEDDKDSTDKKGKKEESDSAVLAKEMAKAFKDVSEQAKNNNGRGANNNQGISLSGLLNAIDGVASPEGRVLVMTTNYPEKLDEALIRPGRVDLKVGFTLATRDQIRELFLRMYISDKTISSRPKPTRISEVVGSTIYEDHEVQTAQDKANESPEAKKTAPGRPLTELADAFASKLDEQTFSPAEIQGFLLTRKKDPQRAVDEVSAWRDEVIENRKRDAEKKKAAAEAAAAEKTSEKTEETEEAEKKDTKTPEDSKKADSETAVEEEKTIKVDGTSNDDPKADPQVNGAKVAKDEGLTNGHTEAPAASIKAR